MCKGLYICYDVFIVYCLSGSLEFEDQDVGSKQGLFTIVSIVSIVRTSPLYYFCGLELDKLYQLAKRKHGALNKDVVHDLYVKFGSHLPSDAYLVTCINYARTLPAQEIHELYEGEDSDPQVDDVLLARAMRNVSVAFELEVDTFLECEVNSTYKKFSEHSGISLPILKKICMFAKIKIREQYNILLEQHSTVSP